MLNLDELKGVHIPVKPAIFPLAVGWWIVFIVIFCVFIFILSLLILYLQSQKRIIKKEFSQIKKQQSIKNLLIDLNELAKKIAITKYGREKIASLYGQEWLNFLNQKTSIFSPEYLSYWEKSLYEKEARFEENLRFQIIKDYQKWIKQEIG